MICVSRPTNPTGNVLTDEEIEHLDQIARDKGIPLLIDNAYGVPFPASSSARPSRSGTPIPSCMSLSKLGLPGTRCGIVIADEKIIQAITNLSGIINLAPGSLGPAITIPMIESGEIIASANRW